MLGRPMIVFLLSVLVIALAHGLNAGPPPPPGERLQRSAPGMKITTTIGSCPGECCWSWLVTTPGRFMTGQSSCERMAFKAVGDVLQALLRKAG